MTDGPVDPDEWSEEFYLGLFSWIVIPLYFGFVTIIAAGIAAKFIMAETESFMSKTRSTVLNETPEGENQ